MLSISCKKRVNVAIYDGPFTRHHKLVFCCLPEVSKKYFTKIKYASLTFYLAIEGMYVTASQQT